MVFKKLKLSIIFMVCALAHVSLYGTQNAQEEKISILVGSLRPHNIEVGFNLLNNFKTIAAMLEVTSVSLNNTGLTGPILLDKIQYSDFLFLKELILSLEKCSYEAVSVVVSNYLERYVTDLTTDQKVQRIFDIGMAINFYDIHAQDKDGKDISLINWFAHAIALRILEVKSRDVCKKMVNQLDNKDRDLCRIIRKYLIPHYTDIAVSNCLQKLQPFMPLHIYTNKEEGNVLVGLGLDGIEYSDLNTGTIKKTFNHDFFKAGSLYQHVVSDDGNYVAAYKESEFVIYDKSSNNFINFILPDSINKLYQEYLDQSYFRKVVFNTDSKLVVIIGDYFLHVFNLTNGHHILSEKTISSSDLNRITSHFIDAFFNKEQELFCVVSAKTIKISTMKELNDLGRWKKIYKYTKQDHIDLPLINPTLLSTNGRFLVYGSAYETYLYDLNTQFWKSFIESEFEENHRHIQPITKRLLVYKDDGHTLLVNQSHDAITVTSLDHKERIVTLKSHMGIKDVVAKTCSDHELIFQSNNHVYKWNFELDYLSKIFQNDTIHRKPVRSMQVFTNEFSSPDKDMLVTISDDAVGITNIETCRKMRIPGQNRVCKNNQDTLLCVHNPLKRIIIFEHVAEGLENTFLAPLAERLFEQRKAKRVDDRDFLEVADNNYTLPLVRYLPQIRRAEDQ